jgi:hypothetical protein
MVVGHNMNVAANSSGRTGLIINRPILSPLGGGLQPATWVTRRQYSRNHAERNTAPHPYRFGLYVSRSSSFAGVGRAYTAGSGGPAAFRHGGYVSK